MDRKPKITVSMTTTSEIELDEGQLEEVLQDYARKIFDVPEDTDITVRIDVSSGGYVSQVTLSYENYVRKVSDGT